jgi:hypothetical protein
LPGGYVHAQTTEQKKREDFRRFLGAIIADLPMDKEIHVILDNYCTHKRNDDWLAKDEGRVQFHTPRLQRVGSIKLRYGSGYSRENRSGEQVLPARISSD